MTATSSTHELVLTGLDGANPLGFLAALGTLRILDRSRPNWGVRISWVERGGWRARLHSRVPIDDHDVLGGLASLQEEPQLHPAECWTDLQTDDIKTVRGAFSAARLDASPDSRDRCDYLAAFGSGVPGRNDKLLRSPVVLPRSDYFVGNVQKIVRETGAEHLRRALFVPWDYADPLENQSLRFDPSEDRRHALQLHAPTADPARKRRGNMLGANRLALEALPLFTYHHDSRRPEAVSIRYDYPRHSYQFTWPMWNMPVSPAGLQSLLALTDLRTPERHRLNLEARGIVAIFRSARLEIGTSQKKFNFAPAMPL